MTYKGKFEYSIPDSISSEMHISWDILSSRLTSEQLMEWAKIGVDMVNEDVQSLDVVRQYFRSSPEVEAVMPFNYFVQWSKTGRELFKDSPELAKSYFKESPRTMAILRSRHIEAWAMLGRKLHKSTLKSTKLSAEFFSKSPLLLKFLTFHDLEQFVDFIDLTSRRSYELAIEAVGSAHKVFSLLSDTRSDYITLEVLILEKNWRELKGFIGFSGRSIKRVDVSQRLLFLDTVKNLVLNGTPNISNVMDEMSKSLDLIDNKHHGRILQFLKAIIAVSYQSAPAFINICPQLLLRMDLNQMEKWFDEGMKVLKENRDAGHAFLKLESRRAQEVLEMFASSVEFVRISDILQMYCRALAGPDLDVAVTDELVEKNIGWVSNESPTTEGKTVFFPSEVNKYPSRSDNFDLYKVLATHQVSHIEFGSFAFRFDRPSTLFHDIRQILLRKMNKNAVTKLSETNRLLKNNIVTDMHRFFEVFEDRNLALDIFSVIEDGRLDHRIKVEYAGISKAYFNVQTDALTVRPDIGSLPAKEALVELLVRLSIEDIAGLVVPQKYKDEFFRVAQIALKVFRTNSTVEDTAEATLRIYDLLSFVTNEDLPTCSWERVEDENDFTEQEVDDDIEDLADRLINAVNLKIDSDDEHKYQTSVGVDYRGDFKPELVQLLDKLRGHSGTKESEPVEFSGSHEYLEDFIKGSPEFDLDLSKGNANKSSDVFVDNLLSEAGFEVVGAADSEQRNFSHVDDSGEMLDSPEPMSFVYDEWDFRADDYRPRWCIVRERNMGVGDLGFYRDTLEHYRVLVGQVRRQFEMMVPEMLRKIRKLEDGEEFDIDDVIEAYVDKKAGIEQDGKIFWRRNKIQRDVAVGFLLDTSASTAETIDDSWTFPDELRSTNSQEDYVAWVRARRDDATRRIQKRIIDVEKESVVLLIEALESIGDTYGIYSFSGYGRDNVEFYTIKDISERLSDKIKSRIDSIVPLHATRMGPAIRHTISKLETQESRTKLLFLISDGRPQDRGYSREGVEKEYAVHDTKMALDEAKAKGIVTFCLTVDKSGHDYLKTMCQDIGYEVLDNIHMLPQRLLYLYKRLTM